MSGHHISSVKFLWGIALSLVVLTVVTVLAAWMHFPEPWNVVVKLAIATVKAFIVASFFMNLWWDSKFNVLLLAISIVFFFIMVGITLLDTLYRTDPIPLF
ncbi:MAG: cytochrome C oxidase subunit IV family protein [Balneolaceae bacterium]